MNNFEMIKFAEGFLGQGGSVFRSFAGLGSGQPWCAAFVSYIFHKSGNAKLFCDGKIQTYCPTAISWCYKNLALLPIYLVMPGDIIFFDWQPNGVPDHIGLVKERVSDLKVSTLEGNTSGSIVDSKTRTEAEVQGVFRPHFRPTGWSSVKKLEIDGFFGYNTIAVMQRVLGVKIDGILGQKTVKAIQKRLKLTQDGWWGPKTSKSLQKMLKNAEYYTGEIDGFFGPKSVKALQKWLNAKNKKKASATQERIDKGIAWAEEQTKKGYHYVNWDGSQKAKECPICHDHSKNGKYYGWNCIGFVSAYFHHGLGLKSITCANNGFLGGNDSYTYLLKHSVSEAQKFVDGKVGKNLFKVIKNDGKEMPTKMLKKGDIVIYYKGSEFWHIALYVGSGKIIDCSSSTGGVTKRKYDLAYPCKVAIRYIGE